MAGLVTFEGISGTIISVDPNVSEMFGFGYEELIMRDFRSLFSSPYREGKLEVFISDSPPKDIECMHKNGTIFSVTLEITKCPANLFAASFHKKDTQPATVTTTKEGEILFANGKFDEMFGFGSKETIGLNFRNFVPEFQKMMPHVDRIGTDGVNRVSTVGVAMDRSSTKFPVCLCIGKKQMGVELLDIQVVRLGPHVEIILLLDINCEIKASSTEHIQPLFGMSPEQMVGKDLRKLVRLSVIRRRRGSIALSVIEDLTLNNSPKRRKPSFGDDMFDLNIWSIAQEPVRVELTLVPIPFEMKVDKVQMVSGDQLYHVKLICGVDPNEYVLRWGSMQSTFGVINEAPPPPMIGDYILGNKIAAQSHVVIHEATHKQTGQKVALKEMSKEMLGMQHVLERTKQECEVMKKLDHPNIIKLIDYIDTPTQLCIVMEYCGDGDLESYVKKKGRLSEEEARILFSQLVSAVQHCHNMNVIHRDIKLENALLHNGQVKLIDFNVSKVVANEEERSTFCGTPAYVAPEIILQGKYAGAPVDVYSLGVCLYVMLFGEVPFKTIGETIKGEMKIPPNIPSPSAECLDLLHKMLESNPAKRASLVEIQMHPWAAGNAQTQPLQQTQHTQVATANESSH